MANETLNPTAGSAQTAVKKNRRGVSNKTRAVAQLKFHEKDASPANGLFMGHLESVTVDTSINAEGKQFTGMEVPHVTLHFASNHSSANEMRHVYYNINPVESNVNTIVGGTEEWKVNNVLQWMKHMLEVFVLKGREMTEAEEDALSLPFVDSDDEGNYIEVEPEEVIAGYRFIFENFAAMMNGSFGLEEGAVAKPAFKGADGKPLSVWLKLLRHKKVKGEWRNVAQNGELGFDSFIGNGVVEIAKQGKAPILYVDFVKESITPKETKKAPSIGAPGLGALGMGGVMPGAAPMDMGMVGFNAAAADAASDMPF